MGEKSRICDVEMEVLGIKCHVEIYDQGNGRCLALTRFSEDETVISAGENLKETLKRHTRSLPMAISCRGNNPDLTVRPVPSTC